MYTSTFYLMVFAVKLVSNINGLVEAIRAKSDGVDEWV